MLRTTTANKTIPTGQQARRPGEFNTSPQLRLDEHHAKDRKPAAPHLGSILAILLFCLLLVTIAATQTNATRIVQQALVSQEEEDLIPQCTHSPWKPNEALIGNCPSGAVKPFPSAKTVTECATTCCDNPQCISWQFRADTGCLQGGDVRLGGEKDGTPKWCSDTVPLRWKGQFVKDRETDCHSVTWDPHQKEGQCFGLGEEKHEGDASPEACRDACCANTKCGAWQWNPTAGCFYGKSMHGCIQTANNPHIFEPYQGRRKLVASRTYADKKGKPWHQVLE